MNRELCRNVPTLALFLILAGSSCKRADGDASAASSAAPSPSASASALAPKPPWYLGRWTGSYHAEQQAIVMKRSQGMVPAWAADDGKRASGLGRLDLDIDADGLVRGHSDGPLGELDATGIVDHDTLRVSLMPKATEPAKAFHGFLIATRAGDTLKGDLRASSGDSLVVRKATAELERCSNPKGDCGGPRPGAGVEPARDGRSELRPGTDGPKHNPGERGVLDRH